MACLRGDGGVLTWKNSPQAALRTTDLIHAAGGGILGHPGGIAAGVAAMRQAWDAAVAGVPIADHARQHPALAQALATW